MKSQIPNPKSQKGGQLPKRPVIPPSPPPAFESWVPKRPVGESFPSFSPTTSPSEEEQKRKLEEMKKADEEKSRQLAAKIIQELEQEIAKWRKIREEQLRARRQPSQEEQIKEKTASLPPLQEPTAKPKRGLFGFWGRRIKSAQQQSQPEMAGRRIGG